MSYIHIKNQTTKMKNADFKRLSEFIHNEYGIRMPPAKKNMLISRLQKRLRSLDVNSFDEYCDYLFSPEGLENEVINLVDAITTNKTDFFRESDHFDFLMDNVFPELVRSKKAGITRKLVIWSAGCSTGEEPYTLAMLLSEFALKYPDFKHYQVLATDISLKVLEKAILGVYKEERIIPVPLKLRKKYLMRGTGDKEGLVRVSPVLRSIVSFRRLNFMEDFGMREQVDIIFCRNVIIYFNKDTQRKLFKRFYSHLMPGGYFFLGHSESLNNMNVSLKQVAPTVYKK